MPRPTKQGLDFFPLDTIMDDKMALLEAEYGLQAFAIIVKLWQRIYQERGYYCDFSPEVALLFSRNCGFAASGKGCRVVKDIVSRAIERGIFDKRLFDTYQILTSRGIQKRFFEAAAKRAHVEVDPRFLLIPFNVSAEKTRVSDVETPINPAVSTQTRVEYSKGGKRRGKESKLEDLPSVGLTREREEKTDRPTTPEEKEIREYGDALEASAASVQAFIETMTSAGWCGRDGEPIRDWKALLRKWTERDRRAAAKRKQSSGFDMSSEEAEHMRRIRELYEKGDADGV